MKIHQTFFSKKKKKNSPERYHVSHIFFVLNHNHNLGSKAEELHTSLNLKTKFDSEKCCVEFH